MDPYKEKLRQFINDRAMSEAVFRALLDKLLEWDGAADVHMLAADRIAQETLKRAWKELEKYRIPAEEEGKSPTLYV